MTSETRTIRLTPRMRTTPYLNQIRWIENELSKAAYGKPLLDVLGKPGYIILPKRVKLVVHCPPNTDNVEWITPPSAHSNSRVVEGAVDRAALTYRYFNSIVAHLRSNGNVVDVK